MRNNTAVNYICSICEKPISDHVYLVQRRKVRPVKEILSDGKTRINPHDAIDPSHAGVILGPERDPYCSECFAKLPTIQELIDDYKKSLDKGSARVD